MSELTYRITYSEVDKMGVMYYAHYLVLFERGRTELLRGIGTTYREMEEKLEVILPAMEVNCKYLSPARYDDLIRIVTKVAELGGASITFDYAILNADTGKALARGSSKHPFVNTRWKPTRVPVKLRTLLSQLIDK